MIYDCLFYEGSFVIAKPTGHVWSESELKSPFTIEVTKDLIPDTVDYTVTLGNGAALDASQIDSLLVEIPLV